MPSVSKHRKIKRPTVIIKRSQIPRNRPPKVRAPSYEKLKSNNHSLARALSQEKQENQSLFSQNVALVAEAHDLGFACKRRDDIICKVLKNAKEMLKMVVTMTNYLTNTISSCQEFTSNPRNSYRSSSQSSRRESTRRLSTKSPARGVVKPMVSGHTITKPTINLSRVNMQNIQNILSLATIEETSSSPDRNTGSPTSVSLRNPTTRISEVAAHRQLNYENRRVCRMPERIPVVVMNDDIDERRLSNRTRISERFSGRFSKRQSGTSSEIRAKKRSVDRQSNRIDHPQIKSPRVALSDVSRLLQNSQTINVRMLEENSISIDESQNDNTTLVPQNSRNYTMTPEPEVAFQLSDSESDSEICRNIPSRPMSKKFSSESRKQKSNNFDKSDNFNKSSNLDKSNNFVKTNNLDKSGNLDKSSRFSKSPNINGNTKYKLCNGSKKEPLNAALLNDDDPLEGSSWMYNSSQISSSSSEQENLSSDSDNLESVRCRGSRTISSRNDLSFTSDKTPTKLSDETLNFKSDTPKKKEYEKSGSVENSPDEVITMNFARFVTKHRGHSVVEKVNEFDEMEDPTIMLNIRQQTNKSKFNIDDLRLPTIESPVVTGPTLEPEITSTINIVAINGIAKDPLIDLPNLSVPRISDFPIPEEDSNQESSPVVEKVKAQRKRKKIRTFSDVLDLEQSATAQAKKAKHKCIVQDKDPSAAKVVLQKLPSQERKLSDESVRSRNSGITLPDPSSDSESSTTSSRYASSRPRRQKAPVHLKEPSTKKKLRRQQ